MRGFTLFLAASVVGLALGACAGGQDEATKGRWVIRNLGLYGPAVGINDDGQIVAESHLWEDGEARQLRTTGRKGTRAEAVAINDRGQVIGRLWYSESLSETKGMTFSIPTLWEQGRPRELALLGGPVKSWPPLLVKGQPFPEGEWGGEATAVNDRGQIIGWSDSGPIGDSKRHAILWEDGKMTDLGTLRAVAINARGQVVGSADTGATDDDGDIIAHAFLWEDGKMTDLGTLGGPNSRAVAINDRGQIVGAADTEAGDPWSPIEHAFVWENGKLTDLGTLGPSESEAMEINERGQIVGSSWVEAEEMVVLWTLKR